MHVSHRAVQSAISLTRAILCLHLNFSPIVDHGCLILLRYDIARIINEDHSRFKHYISHILNSEMENSSAELDRLSDFIMDVPGKTMDTDDRKENVANLDKLCEPCEVDNVNTPATAFCKECDDYMCNACFRQHLRVKSCRHHTLMDINASSEKCLRSNARATKCKRHGGETVKFYCRNHETIGCGDCMILEHNACKSEYISDLSDKFQQKEEYKISMRKIENLLSEKKKFERRIQENINDNKLMHEKALGDIRQFRLDINGYLDKLEADAIAKVNDIMTENETLLSKVENDCKMFSTKLESIRDMLNPELYNDNVLFIHTVECKPQLLVSEVAISEIKSKTMKRYKFTCSQQLRKLVSSTENLGTLTTSTLAVIQQTRQRLHDKEKNRDGNVFTKTEEMSSQAYLPASEMEEMEKLQIFQTPLCLIKSETDGKLSVVEETMSQLEEIRFGVNVIAIAGLYRTGKSYLMNRIAHASSVLDLQSGHEIANGRINDQRHNIKHNTTLHGFSLGNTTESNTKGIWVWCKRHPTQSNQVLVLLDTEGLGDIKKGGIQHDNKIFTLAALLSSTLVYNMMGAFNQDAIEKLTFVTEMSKNMKFGEKMSGDKCLDFVLPRFVLCLRDLYIDLEDGGRTLTPDEYLEDCLKSKQVKTQKDEKYNRPRECIRRYLTRRRVFKFGRPGGKKVMSRLESAHDDELAEEFVEDTVKFTTYIFQCEPKMLLNRQLVTGSMLAELTRAYVKAMREGSLPCVDDAMTTMARKENETMVKKAVSDFEEMMAGVQLPKYNCQELLEINFSNQKHILTTLVKGLVFDDENEAKTLAERQMNDIARSYERKNDEQLQKICTEKLEDLYKPIYEKISNNDHSMSGGYQIYKKDMSELEEKYSEELQHVAHVMRMKVLKSFLDKKRKDEEKILANDQQLTEKEKEDELKEREAIAEKKLKESQDLTLKELEKLKLEQEENIRRMKEEQRKKEEADLKRNMDAIMEARRPNEAYVEELKKKRNKLKGERKNAEFVKAWDYMFSS